MFAGRRITSRTCGVRAATLKIHASRSRERRRNRGNAGLRLTGNSGDRQPDHSTSTSLRYARGRAHSNLREHRLFRRSRSLWPPVRSGAIDGPVWRPANQPARHGDEADATRPLIGRARCIIVRSTTTAAPTGSLVAGGWSSWVWQNPHVFLSTAFHARFSRFSRTIK